MEKLVFLSPTSVHVAHGKVCCHKRSVECGGHMRLPVHAAEPGPAVLKRDMNKQLTDASILA